MPFRPENKGYDFDRLHAILENARTEKDNPSLWQLLFYLINGLQKQEARFEQQIKQIVNAITVDQYGNITANNLQRTASLRGTNTGDVTVTHSGGASYGSLAGNSPPNSQVIVLDPIDLDSGDVADRLQYANLVAATLASLLLGRGSASGGGDWQEITIGSGLTMTGTTLSATGTGSGVTFSRTFTIDGGGSAITAVVINKFIYFPVACTLVGWTVMGDQTGSIEFDVFMDDPDVTYPPTTTIVGTDPPELVSQDVAKFANLTGWTTAIPADRCIGVEVVSASTVEEVVLQLDFIL